MSRRLTPLGSMTARLSARLDITPAEALQLIRASSPVYNIEALDLLDRGGWRAFRAAYAIVAGAQISQLQIFNPLTSATDIILKSYAIRLGVANATFIGWTNVVLGATVGATAAFSTRDSREGIVQNLGAWGAIAVINARNDVVLGSVADFDIVQEVTGYEPPKELGDLIIAPGAGVLFHGNVAGALDVRFDWEEWPRRVM